MPEFVFFKSGAPHQCEAPFSEFTVCQSSYFSNQGRPISPRLHFRSSRFARVRIFQIRAPHQSEAPFSEFAVCQSSYLIFQIRGAPSVRGSIFGVRGLPEFVFFKSGAPHQSEAPFSEFAVCQSSYFSNQGRPISPRLHFRSSRFARVRIFQIRGAPSVRGSIFGVRGLPEFVFFKSGAPHQCEAPFSEFTVCQSSYFSNQGRPISARLHFRSSRFARVRIFQIRGAPSVRGSIFGVRGLPEFVFLKSGAPHQSEAPFSEFTVCQSSYFSNQGRPITIFGVHGLPEFVFFKSGAPHHSEAPFSEFAVCQSSYF